MGSYRLFGYGPARRLACPWHPVFDGYMQSLRIKVSGMVQGVGYRYFAKRLADSLGVKGYVRNLRDGSVEVLAQCPDGATERRFLAGLEEGPAYGTVTDIDSTPEDNPRQFEGFEITF